MFPARSNNLRELSAVIAGLTGLLFLVVLFPALIVRVESVNTELQLTGLMLELAGMTLFVAHVAYLGALIGLVLMVRGEDSVRFVTPSCCVSWSAWAYTSWYFFSRGKQKGFRWLGIEIALSGALSSPTTELSFEHLRGDTNKGDA